MLRKYQTRLGSKLDKIRRKLTDNMISLSGNLLDFLKISTKRTKQGDILSRRIEDIDVIEVLLPPLKDIPMRRILLDSSTPLLEQFGTSLDLGELLPFEIYTQTKYNLDVDDLLIRVISDSQSDRLYCMVLQIKDTFTTVGSWSMIWRKYYASYYDQNLPSEVLELIIGAQNRRQILGW